MLAALGALLAASATLTACTDSAAPVPTPSVSPPAVSVDLEVGVWGTPEEIVAYQDVLDRYDASTAQITVDLKSFASSADLMAAITDGEVPDVFLVDRQDLVHLLDAHLTQPIGERLDERDVDFGDDYSRAALEAFSFDRKLQCMPYGVSPTVVYYNKALIDFELMGGRGLDVPIFETAKRLTWTFEQFGVAAEFATRPRRGTTGFYVPPTLAGIAPFVLSAGGRVFDDDHNPTSLALSSDESRSALTRVLPVLRDPRLTLTDDQLAKASPFRWFERGKLGMVVGDRSLTPALREVKGLDFGVLPMPKVDDSVTVGQITGMCVSAQTPDVAAAADLLVDFVSREAVQRVVPAGHLVPANQTVALTAVFLQPGRLPERADVFNESVSNLYVSPLLADEQALYEVVDPGIAQLLNVAIPDIEQLTDVIDAASQSVLSPPDPSESASVTPDGD